MTRREGDHQLPLAIGGESSPRLVRRSKRSNARRVPAEQPRLPIAERVFLPMASVPETRAECPDERPCPHVRCRMNLMWIGSEDRAGRPGLAHVPRGEHGQTLALTGDAGDEREPTLAPIWLKVRGLEIEREVRCWVWTDDAGNVELNEMRSGPGDGWGNLDHFLSRLHPGEPVLVFDDDAKAYTRMLARAHVTEDGRLAMDRAIPEGVFSVVLTRVRGVSSCALDEIDRRGKHTNEQIGDAIGRHRTLAAREVKQALRHAVEEGEKMGIEAADLVRALMEMGEGK